MCRYDQACHPSLPLVILSVSEESRFPARQILRCAQDDNLLPILVVKNHYRPSTVDNMMSEFHIQTALFSFYGIASCTEVTMNVAFEPETYNVRCPPLY